VDKAGGAAFVLDDVELVTLLAQVAGAALVETARKGAAPTPGPDRLGGALERLAVTHPSRYAVVAAVVGELLAG